MVIKHSHYITVFSSETRKVFRREMALRKFSTLSLCGSCLRVFNIFRPIPVLQELKKYQKNKRWAKPGVSKTWVKKSGTGKVKEREEYLWCMHLLSVSGCISSFHHFPRLSRVEGVLFKDPETPAQLLRAAQHQLPAHWHSSPAASFTATLLPSSLTERFSLQRRKMWSSRNQNYVTCKDVSKIPSKF